MVEYCKQCGNEFEITDDDIKYYKSKNYDLPKRCKKCREENRNNKPNDSSKRNTPSIGGNNKGKIGIGSVVALLIALYLTFTGQDTTTPTSSNQNSGSNNTVESSYGDLAVGDDTDYYFRNNDTLESHFDKHYNEFDYDTTDEYVEGANRVIDDPDVLRKTEAEDGDYLFYLEDTNEFVVVSTDGYIRTYFEPSAGLDYFNRQ